MSRIASERAEIPLFCTRESAGHVIDVVRAHLAAEKCGMRLIVGSEIQLQPRFAGNRSVTALT